MKEKINSLKNNLAQRTQKQNKKNKRKKQVYYSFLTIILLGCLLHTSFGAMMNIIKFISYNKKIAILESKQIAAKAKNKDLMDNLKNFSKFETMESIARNDLKMAGKNEVLVVVTKKDETEASKKKSKKIGLKKK